jgi:hypothetical protein
MYMGPRRSPEAVAVISNGNGANIRAIDGTEVNGGKFGHYEVLPGTHVLQFEGHQASVGFLVTTHYRSGMIGRCLSVKPGHQYTVDTFREGDGWTIEFTDDSIGDRVSGGTDDCYQLRMNPAANPAAAVLPKYPRPEWVLLFGFGWDFGGEDLLHISLSNGNDRTLTAGGGGVFPIGGTWTPLWLGNVLGLGVGGRIGVKFDGVDAKNGSIYLTRFPLSMWLQSYLALGRSWYISMAGGAHKDLDPSLSGDGVANALNAHFGSPWAWFADLGLFWFETWHMGMGGAIRYTNMRYTYQGKNIDASNVGLMFTFLLNR